MAEMGWAAPCSRSEYGGSGPGCSNSRWSSRRWARRPCRSPIYSTVVEAGLLLLDAGSPAQRERCLPRIAAVTI